jgi:TRAP-type C4-dicarboxylate transport system substrate-binding protein
MRFSRKIVLISFVVGIGLLGFSTFALAANWLMPVRSPQSNPMTKNIQTFANQVAKKTNDKLKITIYPADSLIKQPDVMDAVRTRQAALGGFLMSLMSNQYPMFAVDSIPFLATSYKNNRALAKAARPAIKKVLEKQGLKLLFIQDWPFQGIYTSHSASTPGSFKDIKMRAYNHNTAEIAKRLGSTPVTIQQADVPQAFSTGVVDGMITSPTTGVQTQSWDFLNYFYNVKAFSTWNLVIVNKSAFDSLDKETQNTVMSAAKAAEKRIWHKTPEIAQNQIATLKKHGVNIKKPNKALRKKLHEIGAVMLKEWLNRTGEKGQKVINRYKSIKAKIAK